MIFQQTAALATNLGNRPGELARQAAESAHCALREGGRRCDASSFVEGDSQVQFLEACAEAVGGRMGLVLSTQANFAFARTGSVAGAFAEWTMEAPADALAATDDASTSDDHLKNVNQSDPDAVKKAELLLLAKKAEGLEMVTMVIKVPEDNDQLLRLVTNTFAWDTGFFWRRSGQYLLKCPSLLQL